MKYLISIALLLAAFFLGRGFNAPESGILPVRPLQEVTNEAESSSRSSEEVAAGLSAGVLTKIALLKRADQGDPEATRYVAIGHEQGLFGFAEDSVEARKYFEKASDLGDPIAQVVIAELLRSENGSARDEEAVKLLKSASKAGNSQATAKLGYCYASGIGSLIEDHKQAMKLYEQALLTKDLDTEHKSNQLPFDDLKAEVYLLMVFSTIEENPLDALNSLWFIDFKQTDSSMKYLKNSADLGNKQAVRFYISILEKNGELSSALDYALNAAEQGHTGGYRIAGDLSEKLGKPEDAYAHYTKGNSLVSLAKLIERNPQLFVGPKFRTQMDIYRELVSNGEKEYLLELGIQGWKNSENLLPGEDPGEYLKEFLNLPVDGGILSEKYAELGLHYYRGDLFPQDKNLAKICAERMLEIYDGYFYRDFYYGLNDDEKFFFTKVGLEIPGNEHIDYVRLAQFYEGEFGEKYKDLEKAFELRKRSVEEKVWAPGRDIFALAKYYLMTDGPVSKDSNKAVELLRESVGFDHVERVEAYTMLAGAYISLYNSDLQQDLAKFIEIYEEAYRATGNEKFAATLFAIFTGKDPRFTETTYINPELADYYGLELSNNGHMLLSKVVAYSHMFGEHYFDTVAPQKALPYLNNLKKSQEHDHVLFAYLHLARLYKGGNSVPKNDKLCFEHALTAAHLGSVDSMNQIIYSYLNGKGVGDNIEKTYLWCLVYTAQLEQAGKDYKNEDSAYSLARGLLTGIEGQLTSVQINRAQDAATRFQFSDDLSSINYQFDADGPANVPNPEVASNQASSGSSFLITQNGFLATSHHVIAGHKAVEVEHLGKTYNAEVVHSDASSDLALLKISGNFTPLPVVNSESVTLGESVSTIGFPNSTILGKSAKYSTGEVSGLSGVLDSPRDFQVSLPIQPGNSGGPLLDKHGNVVGVIAAKLDASVALSVTGTLPENVNFAVKSAHLLAFLESYPSILRELPKPEESLLEPSVEQLAKSVARVIVSH